jgi:gliding motility-associated-like protein
MTNYTWTVYNGGSICTGGGNSNVIEVKWIAPGLSKKVSVNYTNSGGCRALVEAFASVLVLPEPTPTITPLKPEVCVGDPTMTYTTEPGMTGYTWSDPTPNGTITGGSGTETITVLWNTPGTHTISVSYTNTFGCPSSTTTYTEFVNQIPIPVISDPGSGCVGETKHYITDGPPNFNFIWTPSAGGIVMGGGSGFSWVDIQWTTAGGHSVSVSYTSAAGCQSATTILPVTVYPIPVPIIIGEDEPCADKWYFYSTAMNASDYHWAVGPSGSLGSGPDPWTVSAKWTSVGPSYITVSYKDEHGCQSAFPPPPNLFPVNVQVSPSPLILGENQPCIGISYEYTTQPSQGAYTWSATGGSVSSGGSPEKVNILWTSTGTQTITVTYSNANGCTGTGTYTVNVQNRTVPLPPVPATTVPPMDGLNPCVAVGGSPVYTYNAPSVPGITGYEWEVIGGNPVGPPPTSSITIQWTSSGVGYVRLKYKDPAVNNCPALEWGILTVNIQPRPVPTFVSLPTPPFCVNGSGYHFETQPGQLDYIWTSTPDGTFTPGSPFAYYADGSWTNQGNKEIYVSYSSIYGCRAIDSAHIQITVHPEPTPTIFGPDVVCENDHGVVYSTQSGQLDYIWESSGSINGLDNQPTVKIDWSNVGPNPGFVRVKYKTTFYCPAPDWTTFDVTINPKPTASFTYGPSGNGLACQNAETQFNDLSTAPGTSTVNSWLWDFDDPFNPITNNSTIQNPLHTFTVAGIYHVKLIVTNNPEGCTDTIVLPVEVKTSPIADFRHDTACAGSTMHFYDNSQYIGYGSSSWLWNFGDPNVAGGGTAITQNTSHPYSSFGTMDVKLTVTNAAGCSDDITIPVTVFQNPTADFTYLSKYCECGDMKFFDNSATGSIGITNWSWTYHTTPPSTAVGQYPPEVNFPTCGIMTNVTLYVEDDFGCHHEKTAPVKVNKGFEPVISAAGPFCVGEEVTFTVDSPSIGDGDILSQHKWYFGDGGGPQNQSNDPVCKHRYTSPGTYLVTVSVENSDTCTKTDTMLVTINELPTPAFTYIVNPDHSVVFNWIPGSLGANVSLVEIDPGVTGGTFVPAGTPPFTYPYGSPGAYNVCMRVTADWNDGPPCDSVYCQLVEVNTISASFSTPLLICDAVTVDFHDNSGPANLISQWTWNFGENANPKTKTYTAPPADVSVVFTHNNNVPDTRTVKLTVTPKNGGLPKEYSYTFDLHKTSKVFIKDEQQCLNKEVTFELYPNTTYLGITKYEMDYKGDGTWVTVDPSSNPITNKYDPDGLYHPVLRVTNKDGCVFTDTALVSIGLPFDVAIDIPDPLCTGQKVFLNYLKTGNDTVKSWQWKLTPGIIVNSPDTVTVINEPGVKTFDLTVVSKNNCIGTATRSATVYQTPLGKFVVESDYNGKPGQVKLINYTKPFNNYEFTWFKDKHLLNTTEPEPILTFTDDGLYTITMVAKSKSSGEPGCADTTSYVYDVLFKGLYVPSAFYPEDYDPKNRLFLAFGTNLKQYHLQIFDSFGRMMFETVKIEEGWDGTYQGQHMPQGNYIWVISAIFMDDTPWYGVPTESGDPKTRGTFVLIR